MLLLFLCLVRYLVRICQMTISFLPMDSPSTASSAIDAPIVIPRWVFLLCLFFISNPLVYLPLTPPPSEEATVGSGAHIRGMIWQLMLGSFSNFASVWGGTGKLCHLERCLPWPVAIFDFSGTGVAQVGCATLALVSLRFQGGGTVIYLFLEIHTIHTAHARVRAYTCMCVCSVLPDLAVPPPFSVPPAVKRWYH